MRRLVSMVIHRGDRAEVRETAAVLRTLLEAEGFEVDTSETPAGARGAELILVMGGDGTILRGAEIARTVGVPILGINYGHLGFLSEAEPDELPTVVARIVQRDWQVDERMTMGLRVTLPDGTVTTNWALNDVSIEKSPSSRMIGVSFAVDQRAVSAFRADGLVFSTPTGSTAYNFSVGGPVVWPDVEAMIIVPIAGHTLFSRPLVVSPNSVAGVRITEEEAVVWCDGRRSINAPAGTEILATKGETSIKLARLGSTLFSERLVKKFHLPVQGWRSEGAA
ncbi:NAD kinase [Neoactinobaculum massilliense]|uniref:NAD kinase n=1 Tax=Neoactinobaculum massilliense TaxID=2364794 RepID=UPI001F15016A|nr:NAD kinase [Neoactinobaculum massilliense]